MKRTEQDIISFFLLNWGEEKEKDFEEEDITPYEAKEEGKRK